jgi:hypothetical protein
VKAFKRLPSAFFYCAKVAVDFSTVAFDEAPVTQVMRHPKQRIGYEGSITVELCLMAIKGLTYAKPFASYT